jgi:hypothetical protein
MAEEDQQAVEEVRGRRGGRFDGNRGRGREFSEEPGRYTGGRGNSVNPSWRHNTLPITNSGAIIDPSIKDTATSPLKVKDMDVDSEGNPIVGEKRNLAEQFDKHNDIQGNNGHEKASIAAMATEEVIPPGGVGDGTFDNVNKKFPKRTKMDGADSSSLGSVSSREF